MASSMVQISMRYAFLSLLAVGFASTARSQANAPLTARLSAASPRFCGGRLAEGEVERYLAVLEAGIAHGRVPPVLGPRVGSPMPTIGDWQSIAAAIAAGKLESVGWRGCILSNGKAAFSSTGQGHLRLISFDPQRAWDGA